ncbi:MAG: flavodoxin family protein [Methanomassiliicoccales archaeon]|nr:flavodoxin family protein [Methanomassiliicoccales archaeon]
MIKVVGLMGSPRIGGNSDLLLDAALDGARGAEGSVEKIIVEKLDLHGCRECDSCMHTGNCKFHDDMELIYDLIDQLDVMIISSPVFFSGVPGQLKMMIDRCQCIWARKFIRGEKIGGGKRRVGGIILVGGKERSHFEGLLFTLKTFFMTIDVELTGQLTFAGIDKRGTILDHPTALADARELGWKLVNLVKEKK